VPLHLVLLKPCPLPEPARVAPVVLAHADVEVRDRVDFPEREPPRLPVEAPVVRHPHLVLVIEEERPLDQHSPPGLQGTRQLGRRPAPVSPPPLLGDHLYDDAAELVLRRLGLSVEVGGDGDVVVVGGAARLLTVDRLAAIVGVRVADEEARDPHTLPFRDRPAAQAQPAQVVAVLLLKGHRLPVLEQPVGRSLQRAEVCKGEQARPRRRRRPPLRAVEHGLRAGRIVPRAAVLLRVALGWSRAVGPHAGRSTLRQCIERWRGERRRGEGRCLDDGDASRPDPALSARRRADVVEAVGAYDAKGVESLTGVDDPPRRTGGRRACAQPHVGVSDHHQLWKFLLHILLPLGGCGWAGKKEEQRERCGSGEGFHRAPC
jgi:hypothetical protein